MKGEKDEKKKEMTLEDFCLPITTDLPSDRGCMSHEGPRE